MPLTLRRNRCYTFPKTDDFNVMLDGRHLIGRIMEGDRGGWCWFVHIFPPGMKRQGDAPTFEEAKAAFKAAWTEVRAAMTDEHLAAAFEQQDAAASAAAAWVRATGWTGR